MSTQSLCLVQVPGTTWERMRQEGTLWPLCEEGVRTSVLLGSQGERHCQPPEGHLGFARPGQSWDLSEADRTWPWLRWGRCRRRRHVESEILWLQKLDRGSGCVLSWEVGEGQGWGRGCHTSPIQLQMPVEVLTCRWGDLVGAREVTQSPRSCVVTTGENVEGEGAEGGREEAADLGVSLLFVE